jgi:hypothetical protein
MFMKSALPLIMPWYGARPQLSEQIVNSGYRDAKWIGNGNGSAIINPLALRCVECDNIET